MDLTVCLNVLTWLLMEEESGSSALALQSGPKSRRHFELIETAHIILLFQRALNNVKAKCPQSSILCFFVGCHMKIRMTPTHPCEFTIVSVGKLLSKWMLYYKWIIN